SLYAKWAEIPAYYGEYYGANTYSRSNITGKGTGLSIDLYGKMSGKWSGTVTAYDEETQMITVNSNGTIYYFWYDPASGVLVSADDSTPTSPEIGNDIFVFVKGITSGNEVKTNFAISYRLHNGTVSTGYYTRFLTVNQPDGSTKAVFVYNDRIYSDITIEKPDGTLITVEDVKNQKSVIVKDSLGNLLLAVASSDSSLNSGSVIALDNYYGAYTAADGTVVLDGVGGISYDGKTGRYIVAEGEDYGFDVYLENDTEYWRLTLNTADKTCTIVKPTVTLVLVSAHSTHDDVTLNVNVAYTALPAPEAEGYVFRGWYAEESYEKQVTSYTADGSVATVTLYAKWIAEITLTTNYNYEGAPEAFVYEGIGVGETFTVDNPVRAGYKFLGWFSAAEGGEEWESGKTVLTVVTVVFAHWEVAEPYYNTYDLYYVSGSTANGAQESLYHRTSGTGYFIIDADGNQTGFSASPFTYFCFIKDYVKNTEEGYATFKFQTYASSSDKVGTGKVYSAYLQLSTGIIVMSYREDGTTTGSVWDGAYVFFPMQNGTALYTTEKTSYWDGGRVRTISYKDGNEELHSVFIENGEVYFDVTFMSAQTGGAAIAAESCYQAETVYILQKGVLISSYGYNGTTMIVNDGLQGTYTLEGNADLVLNGFGKFTLGAKSGVYTIVEENTLDAYVLVDGERTEHYTVTLSASAYTIVENTVNHVIGQNPNTGSKEYNFVYDEENGYYYSANGGVSSSYSRMTVTALMAGTLTLEYQVSSENSDPLYFCLNTSSTYSPITKASGANGLSSGASPDASKWVTFTRVLAQGDVIWIMYNKDTSVDTGADTAWIRNVRYIAFDMKVAGDYTGTEGTVNLNGKGAITLGDKSGT
ncbi:MAG: InlB B-repeat-containing protein, partial [Candidatus Gallimonas sp.]